MTLDIRAKVFCDRGRVVSGGFSDDHVQGTGLIRTRGEIVLEGLVTLRPGNRIQLGYAKGGNVVRIPRALRVLSSFADPFRRVTTVSVGCKLTMLENFRENKKKLAAEDAENAAIPCEEYGKIPVNISFKFIAEECLKALKIDAAEPLSLIGSIAVDSFNFDDGYVQILGSILQSQSKIGYLNAAENLKVIDLLDGKGKSVVLDEDDLIDVAPVRSGDIPPEIVRVDYAYNRLSPPDKSAANDPDTRAKRNWELDVTQGEAEVTEIVYNGGVASFRHYPVTVTRTSYDRLDRVVKREETTTAIGAKLNSAFVKESLEQTGGAGVGASVISQKTITLFSYRNSSGINAAPPAGLPSCDYWDQVPEIDESNANDQPTEQVTA